MKISVKQGRLMALMVAMILIIGIFVVGKMLGYGSAKNIYLLEGFKEGACDGDECEIGEDFEGMKNKKEGMGHKKNPDHTQISSTPLNDTTPRDSSDDSESDGDEGDTFTTKETEEFTCGAKSGIPAYDKDDVYAPF